MLCKAVGKNSSDNLTTKYNLLYVCVIGSGPTCGSRGQRDPGGPKCYQIHPPKKHAADPGVLVPKKHFVNQISSPKKQTSLDPKKRFVSPNASPKKPYTTKIEARKTSRKNEQAPPEKTTIFPKKHSRKKRRPPRKNMHVLQNMPPEKTPKKHAPYQKLQFPEENVFSGGTRGFPEKT